MTTFCVKHAFVAALESLCTQNDGVPEWWEGQFVCIQKKADKGVYSLFSNNEFEE